MNTTYVSHAEQEHVEAHAPYIRVWFALLILTVAEYVWARWFAGSHMLLIAGLLTMALVKAVLVAMYFMHVKFEGKWVYGLIVPAIFMAGVVVVGIAPDIAYPPRSIDGVDPTVAAAAELPAPAQAEPDSQ